MLLIHLRMSGDLRVEEVASQPQPHDRMSILFEDGAGLYFNDTRKFGRVWLLTDPQSILGKLGPEPLDEAFTAREFHTRLACPQAAA